MSPDLDRWNTERLTLKRFDEDDASLLRRMGSDPAVMSSLGGVRTEPETQSYVSEQVAHWNEYGFGWWMAFDKSSGEFAGRGGIRWIEIEGREEVEVGYALLPFYWGRGLATELACESASVGFEILELERLAAVTLPTNDASKRVLRKIGMEADGIVDYHGVPHRLFEVERGDWMKARDLGELRCPRAAPQPTDS